MNKKPTYLELTMGGKRAGEWIARKRKEERETKDDQRKGDASIVASWFADETKES